MSETNAICTSEDFYNMSWDAGHSISTVDADWGVPGEDLDLVLERSLSDPSVVLDAPVPSNLVE